MFPNDTLYAECEVLAKRESASRPGAGIVTVKTAGRNQNGVIVCEFTRSMLIMKRGGDNVKAAANY